MKANIFDKNKRLYLDGGMGTLLAEQGLCPPERPEAWNITRPEIVTDIHYRYLLSGARIINTNTFGANILVYSEAELDKIISSAIENARAAIKKSGVSDALVALDIGPLGRMLAPLGDLEFEDAVTVFKRTVELGVKRGVDLIFIETMSDLYETKAALLAAKESSELPVFVCNAYGEDGRLLTGAAPEAVIPMLEGMGADAIGVNCSFGPDRLAPIVEDYLTLSSVPVIVKPNAGLPSFSSGRAVYSLTPSDFADAMRHMAEKGAHILGGCCGTTPEYISALVTATKDIRVAPVTDKGITAVSSYARAVRFGDYPVIIGERINPTGKKRLREALICGDIDYALSEGIRQEERGAHILDVNVGAPGIDEPCVLRRLVSQLQAVTALPLQIDSSDPVALEAALRVYNGKAMVNSVSGKRESLDSVLPLVKKYGGLLVALTLDESGIPKTAEERFNIAARILAEAEAHGIAKKNIIFDPLALTVSTDPNAAKETLSAVKMITEKLGCHTSLGISNVSFGLPMRESINATFLSLAISNGLSAAILNPYSDEVMRAIHSAALLVGRDGGFARLFSFAEGKDRTQDRQSDAVDMTLADAIVKGMSARAESITRSLLKSAEIMDIVNREIIPALSRVGEGFEKKTVYLPELLMSAEAAASAFSVIREAAPKGNTARKCKIVLATVKGDVHDIGKNIVKLVLESFGFTVIDLGRDVDAEAILKASIDTGAHIVGLSALMTTTLPAMERTVRLLRAGNPSVRIMVGGAVVTPEYSASIGADRYARDAMDGVRYADEVEGEL